MAEHVTVLGSGSWGTALAIQYARAGTQVRLWGRDKALLESMHSERVNERYLPGAPFPYNLFVVTEWEAALEGSTNVLVSIPSHAFRSILQRIAETVSDPAALNLCWATKGLELSTGLLPHQVVREVLPDCQRYAVLSGPTFAKEVGKGLPTAITVAASTNEFAEVISNKITSPEFRVYTSDDIVGVEVGGAVKNVLAIGAGLSDGLGFGANARVALINRGLIEMSRLGVAMGAKLDTFMGLAGMGDLVLTCTDNQSRNRRMGLALASGKSVAEAEEEIQQVVEGVAAAKSVHEQALKVGVELPIIEQIYRVVIEGVDPRDAVQALLSRNTGSEID
ncbi:MAG: NAD(P)-dependent glycerol-3-phosphate dehydrogenase [Gammaproteobacteria bacterium]|nr:NAD(P)-dependent glycerol-3-phosphate dehydrogenase [Gammaproteobacteria bacterium]